LGYYYYLAAALPMLIGPEQSAPISSEVMLAFSRSFLSTRDYMGLLQSTLEGNGGPGICAPYNRWEKSLRNDLVKHRAKKRGLDADEYCREAAPVYGTARIAAEAVMMDSPLKAELYLDGCRWAKIDELAAGHLFDIEFIRSYRMKLLLLERRSKFNAEFGFKAYRSLYNRILSASGIEPLSEQAPEIMKGY